MAGVEFICMHGWRRSRPREERNRLQKYLLTKTGIAKLQKKIQAREDKSAAGKMKRAWREK
jgi:hypothetical protein